MKVKDKCFPFGIPPEADTLLFCFHHAGGNAGQLRSWCGVKNDIAVAERLRITATTLDGILTVKGQGRGKGGTRHA